MDVSGNRIDSNVTADTEGSTYLLNEDQQHKDSEALNYLMMPIQVASPMDSMQQEQPVCSKIIVLSSMFGSFSISFNGF